MFIYFTHFEFYASRNKVHHSLTMEYSMGQPHYSTPAEGVAMVMKYAEDMAL